jgi:hypothetical protein
VFSSLDDLMPFQFSRLKESNTFLTSSLQENEKLIESLRAEQVHCKDSTDLSPVLALLKEKVIDFMFSPDFFNLFFYSWCKPSSTQNPNWMTCEERLLR